MKIDGKSIVGKERETVNNLFSDAFNWSKTIDRDDLIDNWMFGPDSVELLIGGELWIVSDTGYSEYDEKLETTIRSAIYFGTVNNCSDVNWICDNKLFNFVRNLSPLESCEEATLKLWKKRWFEIGSKQSLELHLSTFPAGSRSSYTIEWIDGDFWGMRPVRPIK